MVNSHMEEKGQGPGLEHDKVHPLQVLGRKTMRGVSHQAYEAENHQVLS